MSPRQNDCAVRRVISPVFRRKARIAFTRSLSQARLPDSTHARLVASTRYSGREAPSHTRAPCTARRRSRGFVSTTYVAAAPAATRITFATVRAWSRVMVALDRVQLRRDPPVVDVGPVCVPVAEVLPDWLPRVCSDAVLRTFSLP